VSFPAILETEQKKIPVLVPSVTQMLCQLHMHYFERDNNYTCLYLSAKFCLFIESLYFNAAGERENSRLKKFPCINSHISRSLSGIFDSHLLRKTEDSTANKTAQT
jgi:hypothetical protein